MNLQDAVNANAERWPLERLIANLATMHHGKRINHNEAAAIHELERRLTKLLGF